MENCCAIILAAGEGTRMKSNRPKVLCEVLFQPMLGWVLSSCEMAGLQNCCVVTGYHKEEVEAYLGSLPTVWQEKQKGTGHAILCARKFLEQNRGQDVVILYGDAPFMDATTLVDSYAQHKAQGNAVTVISANLDAPFGYGRILRTDDQICAIVEEKDANDVQKRITEVNSGTYWFDVDALLGVLDQITPSNQKGEYYLTDAVSLLLSSGLRAGVYQTPHAQIILGANDPTSLLTLNEVAARQEISKHLANGVTFLSTDGVLLSPGVEIGKGTQILPGTILKGHTKIGEDCIIGPQSLIEDSTIGDQTVVNATQVYQSVIHNQVKIGPFCHIRPNSEICHHVKLGDFVEVKNSFVDAGTSISHLTYIGDSDVGKNVNFGCGVVTVNYDGVHKNRCQIDDGAFIGCNTNLIAPIHVGEDGYTGAGSTITQDVPAKALGLERAKQVNIAGFSEKKLKGRKKKV